MTPSRQASALAESAGVRTREDLIEIRLSGDDQRSWLNGQVTDDVRQTRARDGVYCLAVNVRGKIMAEVWVLDRGDGLSLLVPASTREMLLESFDSQIIMEDVEVEVAEDTRVISVQGPLAAQVVEAAGLEGYACDELGHGGRFVLVEVAELDERLARLRAQAESHGGGSVEEAGFELARLRVGRPRFAVDFDLRHYPQEAGLTTRAVSFNKGCYLGQEVVCTLENRGRLSRRLMRLEATAPIAPGTAITAAEGGAPVGEVTSSVDDPDSGHCIGLGYVKRAHADAGTALMAGDVALTLAAPVDG